MFEHSFSAWTSFFFFSLSLFSPSHSFFFEVEICSHTLILLFMPDQSTVAQRAETTVVKCFLKSCM